MSILKLLDEKIEAYYQNTGEYPSTIFMSKEVEKKINEALKEMDLSLSWIDIGIKNYRGILIGIRQDTFIELKGN